MASNDAGDRRWRGTRDTDGDRGTRYRRRPSHRRPLSGNDRRRRDTPRSLHELRRARLSRVRVRRALDALRHRTELQPWGICGDSASGSQAADDRDTLLGLRTLIGEALSALAASNLDETTRLVLEASSLAGTRSMSELRRAAPH